MQNVVDQFNSIYPRFLEALHAFSDVLMMLAQTVIVAFGIPITLVLLLIVEHQRVMHGILLFEADASNASFFAMALVVLNLALEFQIHYVERRAGYERERSQKWSLRLGLRGLAYRVGLGTRWQAVDLSPAQSYKTLLRLVTFTILALALAGSMRTTIEAQSGSWHRALVAIMTESSLIDMSTWAGGLLAALAAVWSAQGLSRYIALRCAEIFVTMRAQVSNVTKPAVPPVTVASVTPNADPPAQPLPAPPAAPELPAPEYLTLQESVNEPSSGIVEQDGKFLAWLGEWKREYPTLVSAQRGLGGYRARLQDAQARATAAATVAQEGHEQPSLI